MIQYKALKINSINQMRNQRGPCRQQIFKLSNLLDFHEANPQQQYCIVASGRTIKTVISQPYSQQNSQYYQSEESINYAGVDEVAKKTAGLFSNIIQKLKSDKKQCQEPQEPPRRRQYEFYYKELKQNENTPNRGLSPSGRSVSTKRVKERATGMLCKQSQDGRFKHIEFKHQGNENQNYLNAYHLHIHQKDERREQNERKPFVDLDFSFEQIGQNHTKSQKQNKNASGEVEIRIIETVSPQRNQSQPAQSVQIKQGDIEIPGEQTPKINLPAALVPTIISHEHELLHENKNELVPPQIPFRARQEVKPVFNRQQEINLQIKQTFKVEGAKQVQSRIYQQSAKLSRDDKDIKIQFDLDLDFV